MANKGDIIIHDSFVFHDGAIGKKLAVVLNDAIAATPFLLVKTTSNPRRYQNAVEGCNENLKVFFVRRGTANLNEDTFIQLHEIYPYSATDLSALMSSKTVRPVTALPTQKFNELRNCLKRLRKDISKAHQKILFS